MKELFVKKFSIVFLSLLILTAMLPVNVDAKTKSSKTVKIYDFTSGDAQVDKKVRSIIKKHIKSDMTTAQKVKAIHDYIVLNCQYDYENYLNGTIPLVSGHPRGVLINKKAVCQGYAETFQLFMKALNIPCKFVRGKINSGEGHAWNMVQINNKWYHIDVTWNDPVPDEKGRLLYNYFLIPDKKMDDDHIWNKAVYPKCTGNSNKFLKLIYKTNASKNLKEAKNNFYKEYKKSKKKKDKECTVIITKKMYKKYPNIVMDLFGHTLEKCSERITGWSYSVEQYGDYYILKIKVLKVEAKKNISKTLEEAKENFYKEYKKSKKKKDKECTVIITKKMYKKYPNIVTDLFGHTLEKCSERITGWSYSVEQYGDYYILKIKVLKVEAKKNISKTLEEAKENFYKEYQKGKKCTIIITKKLYTEYPDIVEDLTGYIEEKTTERISMWSYSNTEYGDYYIFDIEVLKVEQAIKFDICPICKEMYAADMEECPTCNMDWFMEEH